MKTSTKFTGLAVPLSLTLFSVAMTLVTMSPIPAAPTTVADMPAAPISSAAASFNVWDDALTVPGGRFTMEASSVEAPAASVTPPASTTPAPSTPGTKPVTKPAPVKPAPVTPPVVVKPTTPPAPPVIDHTPRMRHNGNYTPGCEGAGMGFVYSQELSAGGTAVITVAYKYDVTTYSTANGFGVKVYVCDL